MAERQLTDLVFAGFNSRVIALDRYTGEVAWTWKSPKGAGFVTVLLDGDRLIAAVSGYIYCLDPLFGQEVWSNPLKGMGQGVTSLTSARGSPADGPQAAMIAEQQRQQAAAAAAAAG